MDILIWWRCRREERNRVPSKSQHKERPSLNDRNIPTKRGKKRNERRGKQGRKKENQKRTKEEGKGKLENGKISGSASEARTNTQAQTNWIHNIYPVTKCMVPCRWLLRRSSGAKQFSIRLRKNPLPAITVLGPSIFFPPSAFLPSSCSVSESWNLSFVNNFVFVFLVFSPRTVSLKWHFAIWDVKQYCIQWTVGPVQSERWQAT